MKFPPLLQTKQIGPGHLIITLVLVFSRGFEFKEDVLPPPPTHIHVPMADIEMLIRFYNEHP